MIDYAAEAKKVFSSCVLSNFCPCDCHKSMSIPGSVIESVAEALHQAHEQGRKQGYEECAEIAKKAKEIKGE